MKKCLFSFVLSTTFLAVHAQETLETVTQRGKTTTQRIVLGTVDDGTTKLQLMDGGMTINGGLNNQDSRPPLSAGTGYEIRARSKDNHMLDDGFLRLTAGGGTNFPTKSFIELSGYSTVPEMNQNIVIGTAGTERIRINPNGYVGIGTNKPYAMLSVAGDIMAKKVRVTQTGWADYVFDSSYVLPSLEAVEKHIRQYKHLPEIPAAATILKDGLDLGDMQQQQMKKIEELTLYLIEQNKKMEQLQLQLQRQEARIKELEKK
ncbi:hypothetical protein HGH92_02040 [Chitinophaga varians]|uniref:BZIP transcription factor n=1 Tax=Chitinophaga varians TaxID=2202339 RepID=A0A847RIS5_9BACT|nr:hypothetical protein [Chitinophaga varians]NLR63076.1 hypothetical protein [Chitinophaga varians]